MRKWDNRLGALIGHYGARAAAGIRVALGTVFPVIGLIIVGLFAIIMLLDTPRKEDIENAESNLQLARELRDISFQTQGTLYDLARFGGRLQPGEMERATADFKRSADNAEDARQQRDRIRRGRKPIWASAVCVGICIFFLRLMYKAASIVLVAVGLAMASYFFFAFNTAANGVHNLGLLQDRLLGCIIGLAVFVTGVLVGLLRKRSAS